MAIVAAANSAAAGVNSRDIVIPSSYKRKDRDFRIIPPLNFVGAHARKVAGKASIRKGDLRQESTQTPLFLGFAGPGPTMRNFALFPLIGQIGCQRAE
jgi:hypothetical protein